MKAIALLAFNVACVLASPTPYVSTIPYVSNAVPFVTRSPEIQYTTSHVGIVNQIHQVNDDGSYTFGYESADGSFRIENRDIDGFVSGKYGYIDANGQTQEFEYVAGTMGGHTLGYQAKGTAIPVVNRGQPFPVLPASTQKAVDYSYSSVDDDGDGFPDNVVPISTISTKGQNVVRLTSQAQAASFQNPSPILRVVNPVRNPVLPVSSVKPSVVRLVNPANSLPAVQTVQGVQPAVVRVKNPRKKTVAKTVVQQPNSFSGFQVVNQNRIRQQPQLVQVGQSVVRSPFFNNFRGTQQFVNRVPVVPSTVNVNPLLAGTEVRDRFGRLVLRGGRQSAFGAPLRTVFLDDDDDLDDLFDDDLFDDDLFDDDRFVVRSTPFGRVI